MGGIVRSFATHLAHAGARASGFDREAATVACIRLDADTENTVRYIFCDWEGAAGVRSNHGAQVERVAAGIFREALYREASAQARQQGREETAESRTIRLALAKSNFARARVPLADRGWPKYTARPTGTGGGFPLKTIVIEGDNKDPAPVRCTLSAPERWAMLPPVVAGHRGPVRRDRVVRVWRALRSLEARSAEGPRLVVVLHLAYGPRSPEGAGTDKVGGRADYKTFGEVAPFVHLTRAAAELAAKATRAETRARAEARCPDRLDDAARAHWISAAAAADRRSISPRDAIVTHLGKLKGIDRTIARDDLAADARRLLTRASNALLRELREGDRR